MYVCMYGLPGDRWSQHQNRERRQERQSSYKSQAQGCFQESPRVSFLDTYPTLLLLFLSYINIQFIKLSWFYMNIVNLHIYCCGYYTQKKEKKKLNNMHGYNNLSILLPYFFKTLILMISFQKYIIELFARTCHFCSLIANLLMSDWFWFVSLPINRGRESW